MSATVVFDSNQMDQAKLDVGKGSDRGPTAKEIASCAPCRMILVVLFVAALLAMLIGAIIIIATAEKCAKPVPKSDKINIETGMMYSVSPRAFLDSNGDGNGDLQGLISKLPYIKNLGFDQISLLDTLSSSDHLSIDSRIGSLDDFTELMKKAKEHGMHVVLSFNPVYTSVNHPLFVKSRGNVSAYGGLYIWTQNTTDWKNNNNTSGWYKTSNSSYYYGYYGQQSPSLNYENDEVKSYMKNVLEFWLKKGVAGFVLDGVSRLMTTVDLQNDLLTTTHTQNLPKVHALLSSWNKVVKSHKGVLLGEPGVTGAGRNSYYGTASDPELSVILDGSFASDLVDGGVSSFNASWTKHLSAVEVFSNAGWSTGLGDRLASSLGSAALTNGYIYLISTLPGLFFMLYGDEIGLSNSKSSNLALMQWNSSANAGFTNGTPFQDVNADYATKNVATLNATVAAMKSWSTVRMSEKAFEGNNMEVILSNNDVIAYLRYHGDEQCVVAINLSGTAKAALNLKAAMVKNTKGVILVDSTMLSNGKAVDLSNMALSANQAVIVRVE